MQTPKDAWSACAWRCSFCHNREWGTNRDGARCSERVQIDPGNFENQKGFLEEELVGRMQRRTQLEKGSHPLHSSGSLMAFNPAYPPLAGDSSIFFLGRALDLYMSLIPPLTRDSSSEFSSLCPVL